MVGGGWAVVVGGAVVVAVEVVVAGRDVVGATELLVCAGREEVAGEEELLVRQPAIKAEAVRVSATTKIALLSWDFSIFPSPPQS